MANDCGSDRLFAYPLATQDLRTAASVFSDLGSSTLVGQFTLKSLSSVCPSVRPSLSFLKIGSLSFF